MQIFDESEPIFKSDMDALADELAGRVQGASFLSLVALAPSDRPL